MPEPSPSLPCPAPGEFADLPQLAQFATGSMSIGRRHLALTQLADALKNRGAAGVFSSQIRDGDQTLAACLATTIARDAAMLVGCGQLDSLPDSLALQSSLEHLHQQVAAAGMRFVQATSDVDDPSPPFAQADYEKIAQLDYLSATVPPPPTELTPTDSPRTESTSTGERPDRRDVLVVEPLDPRVPAQLARMTAVVEATFDATQDCPKLNRYRSPQDIVAAYLESPALDPTGWRIFQNQHADVACLITTPYQSSATLELTYMGVASDRRGRGWGQRILREAFQIARNSQLTDVMLAVDQQNAPALNVYQQAGFQVVASEAVWGRLA
ncbi:Mycothiol acetyltransferase [Roseimaritima ulvae]|uniref:Mycothiol acetyltransferase n=2 Tax=Roseimaritima ulvae TaxID=980254 RepID=A0A5B9QJD0_9BACT|nr:Mycothiol acetyltransferase [Roseimaritima ulvae]